MSLNQQIASLPPQVCAINTFMILCTFKNRGYGLRPGGRTNIQSSLLYFYHCLCKRLMYHDPKTTKDIYTFGTVNYIRVIII